MAIWPFRATNLSLKALITPKNLSVRPVLVHINGVAEAVEDADYFDKVVDFGALAAG